MLLQFVKSFSLFLDHVTMSEGEVIYSLDGLHAHIVVLPLTLLVLQNLVCLDECVNLVSLIFVLELSLLVHLLSLELE